MRMACERWVRGLMFIAAVAAAMSVGGVAADAPSYPPSKLREADGSWLASWDQVFLLQNGVGDAAVTLVPTSQLPIPALRPSPVPVFEGYSSVFGGSLPDWVETIIDFLGSVQQLVTFGIDMTMSVDVTFGMDMSIGEHGSLIAGATCATKGSVEAPAPGTFAAGDQIDLRFSGSSTLQALRYGETTVAPPVLYMDFGLKKLKLSGTIDYGLASMAHTWTIDGFSFSDFAIPVVTIGDQFEGEGIYLDVSSQKLPAGEKTKNLEFGTGVSDTVTYTKLTADFDELALSSYKRFNKAKAREAEQKGDTKAQKKYEKLSKIPGGLGWTIEEGDFKIVAEIFDLDGVLGLNARRELVLQPKAQLRYVLDSPVLFEGAETTELTVPLVSRSEGATAEMSGFVTVGIPRYVRKPVTVTPTLVVDHQMTGKISFLATLQGMTKALELGVHFPEVTVFDGDDYCATLCWYYYICGLELWEGDSWCCGSKSSKCLPAFSIPGFDLGPFGPAWKPKSFPNVSKTLKTVSGSAILHAEYPMASIELVPEATQAAMEAHIESAGGYEGFAAPGDAVTVSVRIEEPVTLRVATINGRPADVYGAGQDWSIRRVLDADDPDGLVSFLFDSDTGSGHPACTIETTDGSSVTFIKSPPSTPTDLRPSGAVNVGSARPVFEWNVARDSAGLASVEYEISGTIDASGATKSFSYVIPAAPIAKQTFALPDELPIDAVVEWVVRGRDATDRWGQSSPSERFCYYPPAQFRSIHLESSNAIDSEFALAGDTVTLTLEVDSCVGRPTVRIGTMFTQEMVHVRGACSRWTAALEVDPDLPVGGISFSVTCRKELPIGFSGNAVLSRAMETTDNSRVCLLDASPPPAPQLEQPLDGTTIYSQVNTDLSWWPTEAPRQCVAPMRYEVELTIAEPGGGSDIVTYTAHTSSLGVSANAFPDGSTVSWRVRSRDPLGRWSPYSEARSFYYAGRFTVEVNQAPPNPGYWRFTTDPTNSDPIVFLAKFSCLCYVDDFTADDVVVASNAGSVLVDVNLTNLSGIYEILVSGMSRPGTVRASIPAGVAHYRGIANEASTSRDNAVVFDNSPPSISVNQTLIADAEAGKTFTVQVDYPVPMASDTPPGIAFVPDVEGTGTLSWSGGAWSSGERTYTASYRVADVGDFALDVDVTVDHGVTAIWDAVDPDPQSVCDVFSVDTENMSVATASPVQTSSGTIPFTATFSESAIGFELTDPLISNGTAIELEGPLGLTYTITVQPAAAGDVTLEVPAGIAVDAAGNGNEASNVTTVEYVPAP